MPVVERAMMMAFRAAGLVIDGLFSTRSRLVTILCINIKGRVAQIMKASDASEIFPWLA